MFFPDLGDTSEWSLVGFCDAGIKSMPDRLTSVGGQVVLLVNKKKQRFRSSTIFGENQVHHCQDCGAENDRNRRGDEWEFPRANRKRKGELAYATAHAQFGAQDENNDQS